MTAAVSRSLSGQPFSFEHHLFLRTVAATRQWRGDVWVSAKVAAQLHLPLQPDTAAPLQLNASNGAGSFYHADQFAAPLPELQKAWDDYAQTQESSITCEFGAEADSSLSKDVANDVAVPLSTNGERFDRKTESLLLECNRERSLAKAPGELSRYWATAAEAAYIFKSPFPDLHLANPQCGVLTDCYPLCRPVKLYNVADTVHPARFTSSTCRRYDPVNYEGRFYRPCVAVSMKAFAIQHNCVHERQWITTNRAKALGLSVPRGVQPLSFFFDAPLYLINVGVLRRSALIRGRVVSSSVSPPAADESDADKDGLLEGALLVRSGCHIESVPCQLPSSSSKTHS